EASRRKIGLNASVDRLRKVLVKPQVQLLYLLRRKSPYRAFNLLDSVWVHRSLRYFTRAGTNRQVQVTMPQVQEPTIQLYRQTSTQQVLLLQSDLCNLQLP